MTIKLDIFKTYDRLKLSFLEKNMRKLGLNEAWVSKIMACFTTVSYAVLVNEYSRSIITPTKGIHQGDPIFIKYVLKVSVIYSIKLKVVLRSKG